MVAKIMVELLAKIINQLRSKMAEADKEFVEYVVRAMVDNPNDVKVERTIDEMGVLLTLSVNSDDMGKVIGKEGRTAKSIRTLLRVLGAKNNARVNLKILEPSGKEIKVPEEKASSKEAQPAEEAASESKATEVI